MCGVEDVLAAILEAPREPDADLVDAVDAVTSWLVPLERWADIAEVSRAGLAFAGPRQPEAALRMLQNLGIATQKLGDLDSALQIFTTVERTAAETGHDGLRAKALAQCGLVLRDRHEPDQAADRLQRAAAIYLALGDRQGRARTYGNLQTVLVELGEIDLALDYCRQALELFREIGDTVGAARELRGLADYHAERGEPDTAMSMLREALDGFDQGGEPVQAADTAFHLAQMCRFADREAEAIRYARQALDRLTPFGPEATAAVEAFLAGPSEDEPDDPELAAANAARDAGDLATAADEAERAAARLEQAGERRRAAAALAAAAIAWRHARGPDWRRDADRAISAARRALVLAPKTVHPAEWAWAMGTLGVLYWQFADQPRREADQPGGRDAEHPRREAEQPRRDLERAAARLRAALAIYTRDRHPQEWATVTANLGMVLAEPAMTDDPANLEEGRRLLTTALRATPESPAHARFALNLSHVYRNRLRGDPDANLDLAKRYAADACRIYLQAGENDVVAALDALATAQALASRRSGNPADAQQSLETFRLALEVASAEEDPIEYAHISDNFARTVLDLEPASTDDLREALERNATAMAIYDRRGPRHDAAAARDNRAGLLVRLGGADPDEIVRLNEEALAARPVAEMPGHWAESASGLAEALLRRGRAGDVARARSLLAGSVRAAGEAGHSSIAMTASAILGGVLSAAGEWPAAAEAWRGAVAAAETIYAAATLTPGRNAELRRFANLHREAAYAVARAGDPRGAALLLEAARAREVGRLLDRDRADLDRLEQAAPHLAATYRAAAARLSALDVRQRAGEARYGAVTDAEAQLRAARVEIRGLPGFEDFGLVDAAAALRTADRLAYLVTAHHGSVALLTGPSGEVESVFGDLTEPRLLAAMATAHSPADDDLLELVGEGLVGPLAARLTDHIVLIPCGPLAALPLHAARYRSRHLIDDVDVAYAPSARALHAALAVRPAAEERFLGVAEGLPNAAPEVAAVARTFPVATALAGGDATKDALVAALPGVTHLHLACHGLFEPADPLASRLLLARGTALILRDLFDAPLLAGVRMVVASACETAITDVTHAPEEGLGLPAGLLLAGAATAVGSLWKVADDYVPLLMARFYRRLRAGDAPARAMGSAQRWMRDATQDELDGFAREARLGHRPIVRRIANHSHHWAPFVVVGAG